MAILGRSHALAKYGLCARFTEVHVAAHSLRSVQHFDWLVNNASQSVPPLPSDLRHLLKGIRMTAPTESALPFPTLYRHKKRDHWGLALLAWQHNNKRGYLFQDGQLRTFGEEFCGMMVPVDQPTAEMLEVCQRLLTDLGGMVDTKPSTSVAADAMTFSEQVSVFLGEYPEGFEDAKWAESVRGEGAKSQLKRHRAPVLELAKEQLTQEALQEAAAESPGAAWDRVVQVLRKTDLVPAKEARAAVKDDERILGELDTTLTQMLYGEGDYEQRFDAFVRAYEQAHGTQPGWQLATAVSALVFPDEHVVVRPGSFREQSKSLQYRIKLGKPDGRTYAEALSLARQVIERLSSQNQTPRDLIDVHDFMSHTTRAAAKRQVFTERASQAAAAEAGSTEGDDAGPAAKAEGEAAA